LKTPQGKKLLFALISAIFLELRKMTGSKTFREGVHESAFMAP